ncbi:MULTISPECIES: hypothetical protein [Rhizobium]|uniref:Uncharacterized protein n=1 Tax=Rhizobium rhododendri TaxID=2506430 RepID=A0ABY8IPV2_9HYPH|nr:MULTISPECIES: hypothetical protein [Rhizobium]MBO9102095.1 hypothetical protein [Rhizobium sp. L58/93]QXZ87124.1 hypothetical protein J5287_21320 [Rhizobium sp. K1/93]QXZ92842.1 hypothetical protein J5280_19575 [Rhizobium sp. K15/93]QYA03935.1 hypothetical protein J5278_24480 [Rhizobium sp. B21/90]WFS25178.1 hypothetical protein PR018_23200 [Rhizobium rhododendri]
MALGEEKAGPSYFESDGGHEPRLSASSRATIFAILRQKRASLDQLQAAFGSDDPIDFLHALLGHRSLPNRATTVFITDLLGKLYSQG